MAKVDLNPSLTRIRGRIENLVYRRTLRGLALSGRPAPRTTPPSAAEVDVRQRFSAAAAYAKALLNDPVQRPRYVAAAKTKLLPVFALAMSDFLKPPVVQGIDIGGYRGVIGDVIKVSAFHVFEVLGVKVTIRDAAGVLLEQGAAVLTEGQWRYTATIAIAVGVAFTAEAVATDRPGHTGSLTVPLTE